MNPAKIIKEVSTDGVKLSLSSSGTIKLSGDQAVVSRWLPVIREHKAGIVEILRHADNDLVKPIPADVRMEGVIGKLEGYPGLRYAVEAHDDIDLEAVILTLAIRGEAACELRIPNSRYDGFALMELIEKHTTRETLQ